MRLSAELLSQIEQNYQGAQFSQELEMAADDYALDEFLIPYGYRPESIVELFRKFSRLDGGRDAGFFSTHPSSAERLKRMKDKIGAP